MESGGKVGQQAETALGVVCDQRLHPIIRILNLWLCLF
jgi:hypothetical protein